LACRNLLCVHQAWVENVMLESNKVNIETVLESEKALKIFKLTCFVKGGYVSGSPTTPRSEWRIIYLQNESDYKELNLNDIEILERQSTFYNPCDGTMRWDNHNHEPVLCVAGYGCMLTEDRHKIVCWYPDTQ